MTVDVESQENSVPSQGTEPVVSGPGNELEHPAEAHRPFIRDVDQQFGRVYGVGGALVLASALAVLTISWLLGQLANPLAWMLTVTIALVMLFRVRHQARCQREVIRARVHEYCQVNQVDEQAFHEYYTAQKLYPFYCSLYDERTPPVGLEGVDR